MNAEIVQEIDEKQSTQILFDVLKQISPAIQELVFYEFEYALQNFKPQTGWNSVATDTVKDIEIKIDSSDFYFQINVKFQKNGKLGLDDNIFHLNQMIFAGLISQVYSAGWVQENFYFDPRGFYFIPRTIYYTNAVTVHLAGTPFLQFEKEQEIFDRCEAIGYQEFQKANQKVDQAFMEILSALVEIRGTPLVLAIAGPTAAGKTEIVERLSAHFKNNGHNVSSLELDNFLTDRDFREEKGIDSLGREALHFDLFTNSLQELLAGRAVEIPRYDFIAATSSHDLLGKLKPGCHPEVLRPADIIFVEGNSPFLIPEVAALIGVKVVYLTDDPIRMKRKWRRDIDLRKKYEIDYFRNRFFKDQYLMAQQVFIPQLEICDLAVDTTAAAIWASPSVQELLSDSTLNTQYHLSRRAF